MSVSLQPADKVEVDRFTTAAHEALTPEEFSAAWDQGAAMPLADAVAVAGAGLPVREK
jgi:hypothetical protein